MIHGLDYITYLPLTWTPRLHVALITYHTSLGFCRFQFHQTSCGILLVIMFLCVTFLFFSSSTPSHHCWMYTSLTRFCFIVLEFLQVVHISYAWIIPTLCAHILMTICVQSNTHIDDHLMLIYVLCFLCIRVSINR